MLNRPSHPGFQHAFFISPAAMFYCMTAHALMAKPNGWIWKYRHYCRYVCCVYTGLQVITIYMQYLCKSIGARTTVLVASLMLLRWTPAWVGPVLYQDAHIVILCTILYIWNLSNAKTPSWQESYGIQDGRRCVQKRRSNLTTLYTASIEGGSLFRRVTFSSF